VVEALPLVTSVAAQSAITAAFPLFGSLIAGAASIAKARCEVDAAAATAAATELARTGSTRADSTRGLGRNPVQLEISSRSRFTTQ